MIGIDTESDTEILELLEFEPAIPCDVRLAATLDMCPNPAAWVASCRFCPAAYFWCEQHKRFMVEVQAPRATWVMCNECRRKATTLRDLVNIVPIGSES